MLTGAGSEEQTPLGLGKIGTGVPGGRGSAGIRSSQDCHVRIDEIFVMELEGKGRTWPWKSGPCLTRPV